MTTAVPTEIRAALEDLKYAPTTILESACRFYDDEIHPDALMQAEEELARRGLTDYVSHDEHDYVSEYL